MRFKVSPEEILKNVGIYKPEDIDLELVAFSLGAEVRYSPLNDCEGNIIGTDKKAIITINDNATNERKRFSLGHELGHWVNDKGKNLTYRCSSSDMKQFSLSKTDFRQQKEARANTFSSMLIMPGYLLRPFVTDSPVSFSTSKIIADAFDCSVTSAAIRLIDTTEYPSMICCWSQTGERRWFSRSNTLCDEIWPFKKILNYREKLVASDDQEIDGDKWLDGDDMDTITLHESIFFNGFDWLTLLWWQDEEQL